MSLCLEKCFAFEWNDSSRCLYINMYLAAQQLHLPGVSGVAVKQIIILSAFAKPHVAFVRRWTNAY